MKLLSVWQATIMSPDSLQKAAATSALGLAVLSSLYQSRDIVQLTEEIEKAPLFMKVCAFTIGHHACTPRSLPFCSLSFCAAGGKTKGRDGGTWSRDDTSGAPCSIPACHRQHEVLHGMTWMA